MRTSILISAALGAVASAIPSLNIPLPRPESRPLRVSAVTPTVDTSSGQVQGAASKLRPAVSAYLGIPFAKPPVGELRWAAPVKAERAASAIDASKYGPACMAHLDKFEKHDEISAVGEKILRAFSQEGETLSEDCLTLNVWTKPGGSNKAVLLYLYGGGFSSGSSAIPVYDGSRFADDQDVVFVSTNYRLNIFGFPGAEGLSAQNIGLLDQRLAVEWVRDNIKAFGGDPSKITLMGESAGGESVDMYTYAYKEDPIIAGAIAQSGVAKTPLGNPQNTTENPNWKKVADSVGCTSNILECMRKKDAKDLVNAMAKLPNSTAEDSGFHPTPDGKIVFADYDDRGNNGNFAKVPLLVGNNNFEAGLMRLTYALARQEPLDRVAVPVWDMYDTLAYNCPSGDAATYRQQVQVPSWRYRFYGEFPNTRLYDASEAYHTAELPVLFGTAMSVTGVKDTPAEYTLADYMRGAWAAFAKNPKSGLADTLEWPVFNPLGDSLIRLGYDNQTVASTTSNLNADSSCASVKCALGVFAEPGKPITLKNMVEEVSKHFRMNPRNNHVGLSVNDEQFQGLVKCGILQSGPPLHSEVKSDRVILFGRHEVDIVRV